MSIVRIGLGETKGFSDGYDAIFGTRKKGAAATTAKKPAAKKAPAKPAASAKPAAPTKPAAPAKKPAAKKKK